MYKYNELLNEWGVYDIQRNFIKQELDNPIIMGVLFFCDKDGADNSVLEKVEKYNGKLFRVSYSEYLDNGEGGQPRALKTPEKPYAREQCQRLFNNKLHEIK